MADEKDYVETRWRRTAAKFLVLASILGVLAFAAAVIFGIDFLSYGLLVSVILFAPAVGLAGDTRYADVSINAEELAVGQDHIPLKDIGPEYGVRQHANMSEWTRAAISNIHNTHPVKEGEGLRRGGRTSKPKVSSFWACASFLVLRAVRAGRTRPPRTAAEL